MNHSGFIFSRALNLKQAERHKIMYLFFIRGLMLSLNMSGHTGFVFGDEITIFA